jgi:hypothetical protein
MSDSNCPVCGQTFIATHNHKYLKRFNKHVKECESELRYDEKQEAEEVEAEKKANAFIETACEAFTEHEARTLLKAFNELYAT